MSLTGSRVEAYRFELLDSREQYIADLTTVRGGDLTHSNATEIRSGGSIDLVEDEPRDWLDARIRITYLDGADEYPLGIFIAASPGRTTDGRSVARKIELYGKLLVLSQDITDATWTYEAGTVVTDAVKQIIAGAGESHIAVTDSTETLAVARVWSAGTSKLRIINDLLGTINYFSLTVDRGGWYTARPYTDPASRPSIWTFADDETGLYLPTVPADADYFAVPNKVVLVSGDAETEMVAVATDQYGDFGYARRGRWVTDFRSGEEATSQEVLDAKAQRILIEGRQVVEKITITHPVLPIKINDVVTLANGPLGLSARFAVTDQRHTLAALGATVASTLSRVVA